MAGIGRFDLDFFHPLARTFSFDIDRNSRIYNAKNFLESTMSQNLQVYKRRFLWIFSGYMVAAFSFAIVLIACKEKKVIVDGESSMDPLAPYQLSIPDRATYDVLKGKPLSDVFAQVSSVKVVYQLSNKQIYYVNSVKYPLHYDFCAGELGFSAGLQWFNNNNYSSEFGQQYVLASLNYFEAQNKYVLEFTSNSRYSSDQLIELYKTIESTTFIGSDLLVLLNSDRLAMMPSGLEHWKTISPLELYSGQSYQVLYPGKVEGRLRIVEDMDSLYKEIERADIVVFRGTPAVIPHCLGMVTNTIQTPLSHISILGRSRHIPSAADIHFIDREDVRALDGKYVELTVNRQGIEIHELAYGVGVSGSIHPPYIPPVNLEVKEILPVKEIRLKDKDAVGNKAAAFGELRHLSDRSSSMFDVPEGAFAIPFYYYQEHITSPEIYLAMNSLLNSAFSSGNFDDLKVKLKELRKQIRLKPLNPQLEKEVIAMMKECECGDRFRFRSSSNIEDVEGFSGAGLYDSKTGSFVDTSRTVADAIKDVWASTWTYRAFMERSLHAIPQRDAKMAILVHRSFPDERVNGVVVSSHLYRSDFTGHTVNVQMGDVAVVNPPDSVICEQYIATPAWLFSNESNEVNRNIITYSSLSPNSSLLSMEEAYRLYIAVEQVKEHFYYEKKWGSKDEYPNFSLDIEFKLDKDGVLYLKQVRPY